MEFSYHKLISNFNVASCKMNNEIIVFIRICRCFSISEGTSHYFALLKVVKMAIKFMNSALKSF